MSLHREEVAGQAKVTPLYSPRVLLYASKAQYLANLPKRSTSLLDHHLLRHSFASMPDGLRGVGHWRCVEMLEV